MVMFRCIHHNKLLIKHTILFVSYPSPIPGYNPRAFCFVSSGYPMKYKHLLLKYNILLSEIIVFFYNKLFRFVLSSGFLPRG